MTDRMISISNAALETGIPKETLRAWERRYGFPVPERDAVGERLYPAGQIHALRLIKQLLDSGHRPGKVVGLGLTELRELINDTLEPPRLDADGQAILEAVGHGDLETVQSGLTRLLLRTGLERFTIDHLAPLTRAVGVGWARGTVPIHGEHLFSEQVERLLTRTVTAQLPLIPERPVMLTTLAGEQHRLGMRMAEAIMAAHGVPAISLGSDLPTRQIADAAFGYRAMAVALSISEAANVSTCEQVVFELRATLPTGTELWLGGGGALRIRSLPGRTRRFDSLEDFASHLAQNPSLAA